MGIVNNAFDKDTGWTDLVEFLQELIVREEISNAALGIAKQIIGKGYNSLTEPQKNVINKTVDNYTKNINCELCDNDNVSNFMDYIFIQDNKWGYCSMCEYDRERFMEE
jgi:hypothetical protein